MKYEIVLWKIRKSKGITLRELSIMTGISRSELNNIENGKVSPRIDTLAKIADGLGVNVFDLIIASET